MDEEKNRNINYYKTDPEGPGSQMCLGMANTGVFAVEKTSKCMHTMHQCTCVLKLKNFLDEVPIWYRMLI